MDGILIIIIVVILCHLCLYLGIKKRLDELSLNGLPPINIHCTPQQGTPAVVTPAQLPYVSVSPTPPTDEELAAVIMAAIAASESDISMPTPEVPVTSFGKPSADITPARTHEAIKYKYRRQNQRWTATARYENHKRL